MIWVRLSVMRQRRAAGLLALPLGRLILEAAALTVGLEFALWYLHLGRGVPVMFALAVALNYALTRTQWGRSMFAVGANREAARRSGINVRRIYLSAFMLCSTLAALGGILSAARLASSSQQAGTGDVNLNAIADRRHQPVRRARVGLVCRAGHHRHSGDFQRADAAQSVVLAEIHDHRRRPRHCGNRRQPRPAIARQPWRGIRRPQCNV